MTLCAFMTFLQWKRSRGGGSERGTTLAAGGPESADESRGVSAWDNQ
jgi:hypothetical protein